MAADTVADEIGTIGALAVDIHGRLAAAGSMGRIMGKPAGKAGNTAILGAGLSADKIIAVAR